jgi:putative membrane protein
MIDLNSVIETLSYIGVGIVLLIVGTILFAVTTKISEKKLILEEGNLAAALKLGGKVAGLSIVIYAAAVNSINLVDMVVWGAFGIVIQIIAFLVVEYILFPKVNLAQKVEEGNLAVAVMLLIVSIAVGLVVSGSLSYNPLLEYIS